MQTAYHIQHLESFFSRSFGQAMQTSQPWGFSIECLLGPIGFVYPERLAKLFIGIFCPLGHRNFVQYPHKIGPIFRYIVDFFRPILYSFFVKISVHRFPRKALQNFRVKKHSENTPMIHARIKGKYSECIKMTKERLEFEVSDSEDDYITMLSRKNRRYFKNVSYRRKIRIILCAVKQLFTKKRKR